MPKITAIQQQVKRRDRYSIFIDGKYTFSLKADQLVDQGIAAGDELSPADVVKLVDLSGFGKIIDRVHNFLSYRPRSRREIVDYLRRKDCDDPTIERVIDYFTEHGLVDDKRFAEAWATERRQYGLRSRLQLSAELQKKGIDRAVIDEVLSESIESTEIEILAQLIASRGLRSRYDDERKLINYLQGKGFRYSDIRAALEQLDNVS